MEKYLLLARDQIISLFQNTAIQSTDAYSWFSDLSGVPLGIFLLIACLSLLFFFIFIRTVLLALRLLTISWGIKWFKSRHSSSDMLDIWSLRKTKFILFKIYRFFIPSVYKHLWSEYEETLHEFHRKDETKEYRATIPSEAFFLKETLVDNRFLVWNEFFRHLPGILTGLGIIGTFTGLITGLEGFSPSEEAGEARQSLTILLSGVKEAFYLSAFAISCAVTITFLEKFSMAWAYKNVEKITHAIDSLYESGAGEDYLARMVEADEENVAQTAQMKDALVNELKVIFTELTDRQIAAHQESTQQFTGALVKSLDNIGSDLKSIGAGTSDNLTDSLDTLMGSFLEKMNSSIGGEMQNIRTSMTASAQTMQQVQHSLQELVTGISHSTDNIMDNMVEKMELTMQRSLANQENMAVQMQEFVKQLRIQMGKHQVQSNDFVNKSINSLLQSVKESQDISGKALDASVNELLTKLKGSLTNINHIQGERHQQMTSSIDELLKQVGKSVTIMENNITHISSTTSDAIIGMNSGAEKINTAVSNFSNAGNTISGILDKVTPLSVQMTNSSTALNQASQQLNHVLTQYEQVKIETSKQLNNLQSLLDSTIQESSIKKELIDDVEKVVASLKSTEQQSLKYLEDVNKVLIKSFDEFGNAMANQVNQNIKLTNKGLGEGTEMLTGVVQELAAQVRRMRDDH